jgi:hypothetical protein
MKLRIIECIYRKYYRHYSSVVISTFIILYCPTHINRKNWLTNRLSLLFLLNLVSKSFDIITPFLLFQMDFDVATDFSLHQTNVAA